jgi:membrane protease YdiL (CAAX protease family)
MGVIVEVTDATAPAAAPSENAPTRRIDKLTAGKAVVIAGVYLLVQLVVGAVVGMVGVIYYAATRGRTPDLTPEMMAGLMLPAAGVAIVLSGLAAFLLTKHILRRTESGLPLIGWCPARSPDIWLSFAAGVLLAGIYLLVETWVHPPPADQQWGPLATAAANGGWQRAWWAVIALLAPPVEEFVFRGVLWTGLRQSLGGPAAAGIVTLVFVGSHATEALDYWPAWFAIGAMAVMTLAQRARTGSLVPPMALHVAYNLTLVVAVYLGFD